jgi:alginate O-acetyltransferase complex protein AlgI
MIASHQGLYFLPFAVLLLVAALMRSARSRQNALLIASYAFYAAWGWGFLAVLIGSSLLNYVWGAALRRRTTLGRLWIGVGLNVLLLAGCKYFLAVFDGPGQPDLLSYFIRPLGISFWTLQGLSYLFDIYRDDELDPSLAEFCLYMAFWPTVLSGPICRLSDLLPQFRETLRSTSNDASVGITRIIQGLFMKFVLAQLLGAGLSPGEGVAAGFDETTRVLGGLDVWFLAFGFGFQLFFDFAGYSNIVIGAARLFGYRLDENFDGPYLSLTPSAFWTRWHMSLSFWIRDYVFVPLATMRRESWWPYVAMVLSMALVGMWHEARPTFILWGVYHGLLLVAHRIGQRLTRDAPISLPRSLSGPLSWAATFCLVSLGWIFFRASDVAQARRMLSALWAPGSYVAPALPSTFYLLTTATVIGYFAYVMVGSTVPRWRARDAEWRAGENIDLAKQPASMGVVALELINFAAARRWWWLAPVIIVIAVFGGLAIVDQPVVVPTTPFMYTLF